MSISRAPKVLCPSCGKGELPLNNGSDFESKCPECGSVFPISNKVLRLLPDSSPDRSVAQTLMEWEPLINIYDSKLYRKSIPAGMLLGISFKREFEIVVDAAKLTGDEIVLDLACGPGIYSRPLAKKLERGAVIGLDLSLPMLNFAAKKGGAEKIDNYILIHGNALSLPFPSDELDAVICCGALHLFPETDTVLNEIARVLKPGGRFVTAALYNRIPGDVGKRMSDSHYRRYGVHPFQPEELKRRFNEAGLKEVKLHYKRSIWLIMSGVKSE